VELSTCRKLAVVRVLVAEDDVALRSVLERGLLESAYVVDAVGDGAKALSYLRAYDYDVAIVDWRMPGLNGLETIEQARGYGVHTPILMLTARDTAADRIAGLNGGADDYLVKPFDFEELLARLRALQRRPAMTKGPRLACGDLEFDPASRTVSVGDHPVALTATEMGLLELLLRRAPSAVTRQMMAVQVWSDEADAVGSNTIDVHVGRLRAKIRRSNTEIQTIRGTGYRIVAQ
jgi:DNA-binding response OmpR family regulator